MPCFRLTADRTVEACDMDEWAAFFADAAGRRVARTEVGDYLVSTVFIGVGHQLFETMRFDPDNEVDFCLRMSTWALAETCHDAVVTETREMLHLLHD
jgi:hypothetical protein